MLAQYHHPTLAEVARSVGWALAYVAPFALALLWAVATR